MLLPTDFDAVLFDLDGTLIDSAPDLGGAANTMRARRGLEPLPLERYRPLAGAGARGMLKIAFQVGPSAPDFEALRQEYFDTYQREMTRRTVLFDGVAELLRTMEAKQIAWGVVTNKVERFSAPVLAHVGLGERTAVLVCGDTTPHTKPHPEPLLEACRRLGVTPGRCVYVGDDLRDAQCAQAAGTAFVAAAYGYLGAHDDVSQWQAGAVAHSPRDLLNILGCV